MSGRIICVAQQKAYAGKATLVLPVVGRSGDDQEDTFIAIPPNLRAVASGLEDFDEANVRHRTSDCLLCRQ